MDDLIAFLRARLDEDERAANIIQAGGFHPPTWSARPGRSRRWMEVVGRSVALGDSDDDWCDDGVIALVPDSRAEWAHIARHDPARVLRGVAAKRAAINEYASLCERALNPGPFPQPDEAGRFEVAAMMTRALAAEWDNHPDYREEWRP